MPLAKHARIETSILSLPAEMFVREIFAKYCTLADLRLLQCVNRRFAALVHQVDRFDDYLPLRRVQPFIGGPFLDHSRDALEYARDTFLGNSVNAALETLRQGNGRGGTYNWRQRSTLATAIAYGDIPAAQAALRVSPASILMPRLPQPFEVKFHACGLTARCSVSPMYLDNTAWAYNLFTWLVHYDAPNAIRDAMAQALLVHPDESLVERVVAHGLTHTPSSWWNQLFGPYLAKRQMWTVTPLVGVDVDHVAGLRENDLLKPGVAVDYLDKDNCSFAQTLPTPVYILGDMDTSEHGLITAIEIDGTEWMEPGNNMIRPSQVARFLTKQAFMGLFERLPHVLCHSNGLTFVHPAIVEIFDAFFFNARTVPWPPLLDTLVRRTQTDIEQRTLAAFFVSQFLPRRGRDSSYMRYNTACITVMWDILILAVQHGRFELARCAMEATMTHVNEHTSTPPHKSRAVLVEGIHTRLANDISGHLKRRAEMMTTDFIDMLASHDNPIFMPLTMGALSRILTTRTKAANTPEFRDPVFPKYLETMDLAAWIAWAARHTDTTDPKRITYEQPCDTTMVTHIFDAHVPSFVPETFADPVPVARLVAHAIQQLKAYTTTSREERPMTLPDQLVDGVAHMDILRALSEIHGIQLRQVARYCDPSILNASAFVHLNNYLVRMHTNTGETAKNLAEHMDMMRLVEY